MKYILLILTLMPTLTQGASQQGPRSAMSTPNKLFFDSYDSSVTTKKPDEQYLLSLVSSAEFNVDEVFTNQHAHGDTPLHRSALRNHRAVCELLIQKGADVNAFGHNGETPLYTTVLDNRTTEVSTLLLTCGAQVNAFNNQGDTPLNSALRYNKVNQCKLLLYTGARCGKRETIGQLLSKFSPIAQLVLRNNQSDQDEIQAIIASPPSKKRQGQLNVLLRLTAAQGNVTRCRELIAAGANPLAKCPQELLVEGYPRTAFGLVNLLLVQEQELVNKYQQQPQLQEHVPQSKQAIQNYIDIKNALVENYFCNRGICKNIDMQQGLPADVWHLIAAHSMQQEMHDESSRLLRRSQDLPQDVVCAMDTAPDIALTTNMDTSTETLQSSRKRRYSDDDDLDDDGQDNQEESSSCCIS